jgi:predicted TPR repeat methyltransferase
MNRQQRRRRGREEARQAASLRRKAGQDGNNGAQVVAAAHRLFQMGRPADALPALERALGGQPDDMSVRAALAYALAATGDLTGAIAHYREILQRQPQAVALLTNLAVLLMRVGEAEEARDLLLRASSLAPEHANTAYTLGELFEHQKRRDQAFHHYRRAVVLYETQLGVRPTATQCEDLVKLGSARMWTGDLDGALASFDNAVELRPGYALALARRGLLLAKLRRVPEAIASLKLAAAAEPNYAEVRRAIGDLLLESGQAEAAQTHYRAAIKINPHDALASYFLAAAKQAESPAAPPPGYVEQLFDDYAQRFEQHLVDVLQYRVPELMCEAIRRIVRPADASCDVVDLGCGTGLCGPLIRPFARRLIGVDLSAAMLDKAREKAAYDELLQEDVASVFGRFAEGLDLALSADVFVYIGDLRPVFVAAARALRPGGWFVFTTEVHEGEGFMLDTTGRYRHARAYVEGEAGAQGLETVHFEVIVARYQSRRPVHEHLHIMRRI